MKKAVLREYLKNRDKGFMIFLNEEGEPQTVKESYESVGIKITVQEKPEQPNRKTRRAKKGDK